MRDGLPVLGAVMDGLADDRHPLLFRAGALIEGQRLHVAVVDAGVGLERGVVNRAGDERLEVVRVEAWQLRERAGGDVPALVVGGGIDLLGGVESAEGILVGGRGRHRADRAGVYLVEDGVVEVGVGVRHVGAGSVTGRMVYGREKTLQSPE